MIYTNCYIRCFFTRLQTYIIFLKNKTTVLQVMYNLHTLPLILQNKKSSNKKINNFYNRKILYL